MNRFQLFSLGHFSAYKSQNITNVNLWFSALIFIFYLYFKL